MVTLQSPPRVSSDTEMLLEPVSRLIIGSPPVDVGRLSTAWISCMPVDVFLAVHWTYPYVVFPVSRP